MEREVTAEKQEALLEIETIREQTVHYSLGFVRISDDERDA